MWQTAGFGTTGYGGGLPFGALDPGGFASPTDYSPWNYAATPAPTTGYGTTGYGGGLPYGAMNPQGFPTPGGQLPAGAMDPQGFPIPRGGSAPGGVKTGGGLVQIPRTYGGNVVPLQAHGTVQNPQIRTMTAPAGSTGGGVTAGGLSSTTLLLLGAAAVLAIAATSRKAA